MKVKLLTPLFVTFLALLSGCATTASTPAPSNGPSITEAREAQNKDVSVRWGGEVIKVQNFSNYTVVELLSRPLKKSGQPRASDSSDGRFLARINQFLDPENIKPGRTLTVWGSLQDWQENKIGEYDYLYPFVTADQHKVWPKKRKASAHSHYYDPYWDGPFFGSSWWHRDQLYFHYNQHQTL